MEHWWNDSAWGKPKHSEETFLSESYVWNTWVFLCVNYSCIKLVTPAFIKHAFIRQNLLLYTYIDHHLNAQFSLFLNNIYYTMFLGMSALYQCTVWQLTEFDDTRNCIYTIFLLKMSTAMLETCRGA